MVLINRIQVRVQTKTTNNFAKYVHHVINFTPANQKFLLNITN